MQSISNNLLTAILSLFSMAMMAQTWESVERNGMTVQWNVEGDMVNFRMMAPTEGWVALGYNTKDQLQGSTLIMATILGPMEGMEAGKRIEEHFIVKPGVHKNITDLGKNPVIKDTKANLEDGKYTMAFFSVPLNQDDGMRVPLQVGKTYYFILAFSESDDFQHHSIMRTSVRVTL